MRTPAALLLAVLLSAAAVATAPQDPSLTFRSSLALVTVDAVVRDRVGRFVRDLTVEDFEILEDGVRQQVVLFALHEIASDRAAQPATAAPLLSSAADGTPPAGPIDVSGRRLIVMLFDLVAMTPDDIRRATAAGRQFVEAQMAPEDLVAVATVASRLDVLEDFTSDAARIRAALARILASDTLAIAPAAASTMATDEREAGADASGDDAAPPAPDDTGWAAARELALFDNDRRLRALRTLAETLAPIELRKAIVYFSGGLDRAGHENQVSLRAAVDAAVRGHVAIYPVDARGLQAVVPGGDATRQSGRGAALFTGADVIGQYDRLSRSQETLVTLAADTGGRAFFETNDLSEAFLRVQQDLGAYYLLGYTSTNVAKDGRFRRIQVRVTRPGARVETRDGYYADRDFVHTSRADRETQLRAQLEAAVSVTDLPVALAASWFRVSAEDYEVPVALAVPGAAMGVPADGGAPALDLIGQVVDEQQRAVASLRETVRVDAEGEELAAAHVQYQTILRLPPGRFQMKVVVRENGDGRIGSFETTIVVPDLSHRSLEVSPIVLSTEARPAAARPLDRPLVRDRRRLLPSPTYIVRRDQTLVLYAEVYDPVVGEDGRPLVRSSVTFFRHDNRVFATPLVQHLEVNGRSAIPVATDVSVSHLEPGLYTAQLTVIDAVSRRFVFPRVVFFVR